MRKMSDEFLPWAEAAQPLARDCQTAAHERTTITTRARFPLQWGTCVLDCVACSGLPVLVGLERRPPGQAKRPWTMVLASSRDRPVAPASRQALGGRNHPGSWLSHQKPSRLVAPACGATPIVGRVRLAGAWTMSQAAMSRGAVPQPQPRPKVPAQPRPQRHNQPHLQARSHIQARPRPQRHPWPQPHPPLRRHLQPRPRSQPQPRLRHVGAGGVHRGRGVVLPRLVPGTRAWTLVPPRPVRPAMPWRPVPGVGLPGLTRKVLPSRLAGMVPTREPVPRLLRRVRQPQPGRAHAGGGWARCGWPAMRARRGSGPQPHVSRPKHLAAPSPGLLCCQRCW